MMNPNPYQYQSHYPTCYPPLPPNPPPSSSFWTNPNFHDRLKELHDTFSLAKSMKKELEALIKVKESNESAGTELSEFLEGSRIDFGAQEKISVEAASGLRSKLRFVLEPFRAVVDAKCPWEEKSSVARLRFCWSRTMLQRRIWSRLETAMSEVIFDLRRIVYLVTLLCKMLFCRWVYVCWLLEECRFVSCTVGENGIVLAAHRQHFSLRGTKFSLPLPQSGIVLEGLGYGVAEGGGAVEEEEIGDLLM